MIYKIQMIQSNNKLDKSGTVYFPYFCVNRSRTASLISILPFDTNVGHFIFGTFLENVKLSQHQLVLLYLWLWSYKNIKILLKPCQLLTQEDFLNLSSFWGRKIVCAICRSSPQGYSHIPNKIISVILLITKNYRGWWEKFPS